MNVGARASSSSARNNEIDSGTQRRDLRLFEQNLQKSLSTLRSLRRRYQCVVVLMMLSSGYWTWRLKERLSAAHGRTSQEEMRLWCAWALLGVAPLILFFVSGMYRKTIVEPSRFIDQLNRSLVQFYVSCSEETGKLHRTVPPERASSYQQPVRLRGAARVRRGGASAI